jgi:lipopolysaccharide biosynthesis glycosyltransferase
MNIVLTVDNNFAPQAAACITSVCENNTSATSISFYILTTGIEESAQVKLQSLVTSYKRSLHILDIGDIYQYFDSDFDTEGWNEIVLARLIMSRFLPESINRVLYLDGDTIVRRNLTELWETDLNGCILGAVREPTATIDQRKRLKISDMRYFNAGVLLIDLNAWRQENIEQLLFDYCRANWQNLFANDQDAINGALAGRIMELSPAYNYVNSFYYYPYPALTKMVEPANYIPRNSYEKAVSNPAIIHYLGEERPWRAGNTHQYRNDYMRYLSLTPFSNAPMEEGWQMYFTAWKVFNCVTKPFPMLRYRIITSLIPAFMRYRAAKRKRA